MTRIDVFFLVLLHLVLHTSTDSIGSGNGLAPIRRQAIIWTNAVVTNIITITATQTAFQYKDIILPVSESPF